MFLYSEMTSTRTSFAFEHPIICALVHAGRCTLKCESCLLIIDISPAFYDLLLMTERVWQTFANLHTNHMCYLACFASLVSQDYVNGTDQEEIRTGSADMQKTLLLRIYVVYGQSLGNGGNQRLRLIWTSNSLFYLSSLLLLPTLRRKKASTVKFIKPKDNGKLQAGGILRVKNREKDLAKEVILLSSSGKENQTYSSGLTVIDKRVKDARLPRSAKQKALDQIKMSSGFDDMKTDVEETFPRSKEIKDVEKVIHISLISIKIIPIEGKDIVNGENQKMFGEILHEIIISNLHCVKGSYPEPLLKAWDAFDKERQSENDRPDFFGNDQLFLVLEFEFGGSDLENMQKKLPSLITAKSILHQVTAALAVAEQAFCFEHRDLHWGNILVKKTNNVKEEYMLNGTKRNLITHGYHVNLIDYSLSRLEIG
ncbi:HASP kinase, partial [Polypterus senegalus]